MKRLLASWLVSALLLVILPQAVVSADTIYLPSKDSSQYLPTVKILTYSLGYDGELVAEGLGSGTLIDNKGTILTNNHVVESYYNIGQAGDAFQVCLTRSNATEEPICEFTASLVARDEDRDLALLKMDQKSIVGESLVFDFYLPYKNEGNYDIAEGVTVIGFPDAGGRTITFTTGVISGYVTEFGVDYIKTDAAISFGNSGGTAVDSEGNLIGVPTLGFTNAYGEQVLGGLFPVKNAVSWVEANATSEPVINETATSKLKEGVKKNIEATKTGHYKNDYPPYEISLVDGWKFGNSLEGAFEQEQSLYPLYGDDALIIYPVGEYSPLYVGVGVFDYAFEVELSDIESLFGDSYYDDYSETPDEGSGFEEVKLNDKYPAMKDSYEYYDWYYGIYINAVTYYIPYGDKVISVFYDYAEEDADRLAEVEEIIASFAVDMSAVEFSVDNVVESEDPKIKVVNEFDDMFLSDESYEYDGVNYFGASFGRKNDPDFYVDIYSSTYWDETYVDDFEAFKEFTLEDAESWYEVVASGDLTVDGHKGFFYTDEYDDYYGKYVYTTIYIENDSDSYFTIYTSSGEEGFEENLKTMVSILKKVELSNDGAGKYSIPDFYTGQSSSKPKSLQDIENYIYEYNIENLDKAGAFGENAPAFFNPAGPILRESFVVWAVKSLSGTAAEDFATFESEYDGCGSKCFADYDYSSANAVYIDYAHEKGAIGGMAADGNYYFRAGEQTSLMAALKIIFELYDYEVWQAPDFVPWYVPYLHLGYVNYVIPYGVSDANYLLTRGEGVYIIDTIRYANEDYYYDDYYYEDYWY